MRPMILCDQPKTPCASHNFPVVEYIDEAFFYFNEALEIEYLNQQGKELSKKIYGRVPQPGDYILNYISAGRRKSFQQMLQQVLQGNAVQYEIQVEGTDVWLSCKYFPGKDECGIVTGIYGLLKDTTTKKALGRLEEKAGLIEKDLFQSRLMFEQFMQNSPLISWLTDAAGNMQYMNPTLLTTYGFTEADFGRSIYELYDAQIAVDYHMNNQKVIRDGKVMETIERGKKACGEEQVLKVYKFPLLVKNEMMVGGWAVDITDQVDLQEKLIKSLERHEYVHEATSDAVYDWNITTGLIYRSTSYETLFGYTEREATLKTRLSLIHPDDYENYKQQVFKALRNGKDDKWEVEYRFKHASGQYKTIVDKAFIIRSGRRAVRVIGAMQDITSQIELQQKLIKQEKEAKQELVKSIIEAQDKERRQLSVELHDNVNQMLASCKLMLEVALENDGNAKLLTGKAYQSIETVINEIRKISHDLNPSAIADVGLIEAIDQLIEKINISGKIAIRFECDKRDYKQFLTCDDKIAVFRIMQEQLNNILKHAKATHVLIKLETVNNGVSLFIKDNGIGFDPDRCKKGLGLRNIYNRVEYYGGTVNINTGIGKGVEMCIVLKAAPRLKIA